MQDILNIFFPKSCSICAKKGEYLCPNCKKLFKRNLPECYICRRISSNYGTHNICKKHTSLEHVFVCWKYDSLSADILKKYKYRYVFSISDAICSFLSECITKSNIEDIFKNSLIVNVPISSARLGERGFNQTYDVAQRIAKDLNLKFLPDLIGRKNSLEHQSLKDKDERKDITEDDFFFLDNVKLDSVESITIVDDVLTTGATLESISKLLKSRYNDIAVNAICLFRGLPYYSESSKGSSP